jgi:uncharacterized protein
VSLRQRLQQLPGGLELPLVLLVAFGGAIPQQLRLLFPGAHPAGNSPPITARALLLTLGYELAIAAVLALFLHLRGWTPARLGLERPQWRDALGGAALALAAELGYLLLWTVAVHLWPAVAVAAHSRHLIGSDLTWASVLLVSLINPVFEEVFLCGYPIAALRGQRSLTPAINLSAALRVFFHLYQGVVGVLGVVPLALLFAYAFARRGRLWPLIFGHALLDLVALGSHVRLSG